MSEINRNPHDDPQNRQQQQTRTDDDTRNNSSASSPFVTTGLGNVVVPTAPYPPMNNYYDMQSVPSKSSLSSSPQYSTTYGRASTPTSIIGEQIIIAPESGLIVEGTGTAFGNFSPTPNSGNSKNNDDSVGLSSSSMLYSKNAINSSSSNNVITGSSNFNASIPSSATTYPSEIMFCPGRHNIVASINCVSLVSKKNISSNRKSLARGGNSSSNDSIDAQSSNSSGNTNGPIMLELRRLEAASKNGSSRSDSDEGKSDEDGLDSASSFFTTRVVAVSRGNLNLGLASVASTCMDLPSRSIVQSYDKSSAIVAATGSSSGALCIHRFNTIQEYGDYSDTEMFSSAPIEYFHTPRQHRKASSVAWRPSIHTNHVAIGLVGANTIPTGNLNNANQHQLHRRGGTIKMRSVGSDREYCCFLWDILDTKKTTPLSKFAFNSPVASLAWMMDGQTLAVGGQQRTIQLYDLRVSAQNNNKLPPLSAHAHESGVHGIEVDPHRPHLMATFCRSVGEPIKLFDIRRMDSVVSEIKLSNNDTYNANSSTTSLPKSLSTQRIQQVKAEAVKWSLFEPGMLSVASGETVQEYDTNSGSRPSLVRMNRVSKAGMGIKAIALYRGKEEKSSPEVDSFNDKANSSCAGSEFEKHIGETNGFANKNSLSEKILSRLYSKRMLIVLEDQTIEDVAMDMNAPLAISRRDGRLVHSLGPYLFMGSSSEGPSAMERIIKRNEMGQIEEEDISAIMMRRARCLQSNPYSMNSEQNIKLMSQEVNIEDLRYQCSNSLISTYPRYSNRTLLRLWGWIERVESMSFQDIDDVDEDPTMIRDISNAGVLQLLNFQKDEGNDVLGQERVLYSETLDWNVYDSAARRAAMSSCGWAGKFDLTIVMAECEALGEYERSAAIAVWHEDMGAAVECLQRASETISLQIREEGENRFSPLVTTQYSETLGLISMCIAGFGGKTASQRLVWARACASLLRREDLSSMKTKNSTRVAYLRALCEFLMNAGTNVSILKVLENSTLSLCDRVAFACRFLERKELATYLLRCVEICQHHGDVEGLAITGLSKPGIKILQSFVDHYSDVQTAALVVSRVILPADWTPERKICSEWVECYRSLLNVWQMWQSRAMFDVDRADLLRLVKARSGGASYQRRLPNPRGRQNLRAPDPDILPRIPAQLDARCNYCNSSLSLKKQEGVTNQWLSKMQPLLNCCPQCRKPLPRCSVCLLPMGALNPYMELTRARQGNRGNNISSPDDLSSLSSMNFSEWYTWCVR